jgi:drug/metabolite transporter (DMT)-like permease
MVGRRWPRTGTEPLTARSAVGLRLLLAGGVIFAIWAAGSDASSRPSSGEIWTLAIICAVLALLSLVDLTVVLRRRRREQGR